MRTNKPMDQVTDQWGCAIWAGIMAFAGIVGLVLGMNQAQWPDASVVGAIFLAATPIMAILDQIRIRIGRIDTTGPRQEPPEPPPGNQGPQTPRPAKKKPEFLS